MVINVNFSNDPANQNNLTKSGKPSRRGENLSLQDRRRGGQKSASRQTRDSTGKFAGAVRGSDRARSASGNGESGSSSE